jgi:hypothetical protein
MRRFIPKRRWQRNTLIGVGLYLALAILLSLANPTPPSPATPTTTTHKSRPQPVKEKVSPACEEARERAREENSNPNGDATYAREDREVVQEECGAAARKHWAEMQHEQTPQGKAEEARKGEENAVQVQEETKEAEAIIKRRQAEETANAIEGR